MKLKNIKNKIGRMGILISMISAGCVMAAGIKTQETVSSNSNQTFSTKSHSNKVQVNIAKSGSLYILRILDVYYFWVINRNNTTVELIEKRTVDINTLNTLEINLHPATKGLFYADNIVDENQNIQVEFKGQLTNGKVAIPLPISHYEALENYTSVVNQPILIDSNTPGLLNLVDQQNNIYTDADQTIIDVENFTGDNKVLISSRVHSFYELLVNESNWGNQQMGLAEAENQYLSTEFIDTLNVHLAQIENTRNELTQSMTQDLLDYDTGRDVKACIRSEKISILRNNSVLATNIEDAATEDEEELESIEVHINDVATIADRSLQKMEACSDILGVSQEHESLDLDDQTTYIQIANRADNFKDNMTTEISNWETHLEDEAFTFMYQLQTYNLVAVTEGFNRSLSDWISPRFADQGVFFDNPVVTAQTAEEQFLHADAWLETFANRSADQLCENETFNISFDINGMKVIIGTWWEDQIIGGDETNFILALAGDDCIESHGGVDVVLGNRGQDRIFLGDDHDVAHGGTGDDEIHGGAGETYSFEVSGVEIEVAVGNVIIGGAGNDYLFGGEVSADTGENGEIDALGYADIVLGDAQFFGDENGNDIIDGEMGIDFLLGLAGNDDLKNISAGAIKVAGVNKKMGSFFFGNSGDDRITGSNTRETLAIFGDFIFAGDGADIVNANKGRDFILGGKGTDSVGGGSGQDFIFAGDGNDLVSGDDGIDLIFAGDGNDAIAGGKHLDVLFGNSGDDRITGQGGPDILFGGKGRDTIDGNDGIDLSFGGSENDNMWGGDKTDLQFGGSGRDRIFGQEGWDMIFGNSNADTLYGGDGVDVIFGNSNGVREGTKEKIYGGDQTDILFGNAGTDIIFGEQGMDLIFGNEGRDVLDGGTEMDIIFGNTGNDSLYGYEGNDVLYGNAGNDRIRGEAGTDLAFGNQGCDIMYGGSEADLLFGNDDNDRIEGGDASDLLFGNKGDDELMGGNHDDILFGDTGSDMLNGGNDTDALFAGSGNDHILGGSGADLIIGSDGNDFADGQSGDDYIFGGKNNDTLKGGDGDDYLFGNLHDDKLDSGTGIDFSYGNRGHDRLRAVEGRNFAFGNSDNDVLDGYYSGDGSRDYLFGNRGSDTLTGNKRNERDRLYGGNKYRDVTKVNASEFNENWVSSGCN